MLDITFTGHRPPRIGGYDMPNPMEQWVRSSIRSHLVSILQQNGGTSDLRAHHGGALGSDTIFHEECVKLCIPVVIHVPFPGQESKWPASSQARYADMLRNAEEVRYTIETKPDHNIPLLMYQRNTDMIDYARSVDPDLVECMAVFDGHQAGGTWHCIKYCLGLRYNVTIINPSNMTVHPYQARR